MSEFKPTEELIDRFIIQVAKSNNSHYICKCIFGDCDKDSKPREAHLYINKDTTQYHCKKCGSQGNAVTMANYLNIPLKEIFEPDYNNHKRPAPASKLTRKIKEVKESNNLNLDIIEKYHKNLMGNHTEANMIKKWLLEERGFYTKILEQYRFGYGEVYGVDQITVPVKNIHGEYIFLIARRSPFEDSNNGRPKYINYPKGVREGSQIFQWSVLESHESVFLCEGIYDAILLNFFKIPAITPTHGAQNFKDKWIKKFKHVKKLYICYDNDEAGQEGFRLVVNKLYQEDLEIYKVELPKFNSAGKVDITDYFMKYRGDRKDLFDKYAMKPLIIEHKCKHCEKEQLVIV